MSTATKTAPELWMSEQELADLEKEAGRPFANTVEAHRYRLRRLKSRLIDSMLARQSDPMEFLLAENSRRLEADRHAFTRLPRLDVVTIAFEVFECLKFLNFPHAETQRFLRMLDNFGRDCHGLLCLAEAVRIAQWRR
jgi:hypothetical protein